MKSLKRRVDKLEKQMGQRKSVTLGYAEMPLTGEVRCLFGDEKIIRDDKAEIKKAIQDHLKKTGQRLGVVFRIKSYVRRKVNPEK